MLSVIFSIALCLAAVIAMASLFARWMATGKPIKHGPAKIVAKRSETSGFSQQSVSTRYFATFELPSGTRMEFVVAAREFGVMAEGDKGTLSRRGRVYLGFDRERG